MNTEQKRLSDLSTALLQVCNSSDVDKQDQILKIVQAMGITPMSHEELELLTGPHMVMHPNLQPANTY
jgi:hypothetical protein